MFLNLDLSSFPDVSAKTGRKGYSKRALLCAFIVMKCECFSCITDLLDYLQNNLLIAYYCGFDITKPLPSYWTLDRFIRTVDNNLLKSVMREFVINLSDLGVIDTSFIALDSTPIFANAKHNNPKLFIKNKFSKDNRPKSDNSRHITNGNSIYFKLLFIRAIVADVATDFTKSIALLPIHFNATFNLLSFLLFFA